MKTIIGLGQAGCNIADQFAKYPEYEIYKIDTNIKGKNCHSIRRQNYPEKYEEKCPNLKSFFKNIKGDILFITSCGIISGASLRILEQLKNKGTISILYIKPDIKLLGVVKTLQENAIFNVFQEYARSAVFERIYIVDNLKIADIIGNVPIRKYYDHLNSLIVSTMHMINIYNHTTPEMSTFFDLSNTMRISTFGLVNFETGEERLFFTLKDAYEKRYYYAIPENKLHSDAALMKKITEQVKHGIEQDKMKVSYGIFSTTYEDPYVYCTTNSRFIQKNEKNTLQS